MAIHCNGGVSCSQEKGERGLFLFSGAPCCHLSRIQLFLQIFHQFRQYFFRIPLHRAPRLRTLRRQFTILSRVVMLFQGRSP